MTRVFFDSKTKKAFRIKKIAFNKPLTDGEIFFRDHFHVDSIQMWKGVTKTYAGIVSDDRQEAEESDIEEPGSDDSENEEDNEGYPDSFSDQHVPVDKSGNWNDTTEIDEELEHIQRCANIKRAGEFQKKLGKMIVKKRIVPTLVVPTLISGIVADIKEGAKNWILK
jgi:hypothetical protein